MMNQNAKEYMLYNGFTTSPDSFLPFLITENPNEIIGGKITFNPVLMPKQIDELLEKIHGKYPDPSLENGYLINFAEIYSLSISMYPLIYNNGTFDSIDNRFLKLGTKAVVIYEPAKFIERLREAVAIRFPNIRFLEVGSVQYGNDLEQWNLYDCNENDAWKKEFLVTAKLNPMLRFARCEYAQPVTFSIGDLSQIAVAVSVADLTTANFPAELSDKKLIQYMDSYIPKKKGIQNYSFSFMAELQDIVPNKKWLSEFGAILGSEWVANTSIERLFGDGGALPRLVYHHFNGIDKIHIGINRMEISFAQYSDRERKIIKKMLDTIDGVLKLRYCRMAVTVNANLGTATEAIAVNNAFVKETKVKFHKGLQVTHDIETDYCVHRNILGIDSVQRAWHYTIKTETPESEIITWYKLIDVIDFYEEVSAYNAKVISSLLRGNAYAGYKDI